MNTLLNSELSYLPQGNSADARVQAFKRHPSEDLYVIGITGTNGKTTVAHLIGKVLERSGYKPFVLGTLNSGNKDLSTPEPDDIVRFMAEHLENGGTHFIMEVTSEGIDQCRIAAVDFNVKLLTNITPDHLDYHKTFDNYKQVKLGFMAEGGAHKVYPDEFKQADISFPCKLLGAFNHLNIQAAASVLRYMRIPERRIRAALSSCTGPKGRLEQVEQGQEFIVLIDYAHTSDALKNVLGTLKDLASSRGGRLLVLFGCGGNRDSIKRPRMGKIASEIADFVVITDDNPRNEDGRKIMAEIELGIVPSFNNYSLIQDRSSAIKYIINQAHAHDVVILAGKGHETYQVQQSGTIHFDDREEAVSALKNCLTHEERLGLISC
ncbi:MAG: hypothetical protein COA42_22975 [Alteromonadaceae bacterium]|nr:MAG: hypothetical protein COA42_22975 [Alteromonadaceae bacterium]